MKIFSFFFQHKSNIHVLLCTILLFLFSPTTLYASENSIPAAENPTEITEEIITEESTIETLPTEISTELPIQEIIIPEDTIIEVSPELPPQDTTVQDNITSAPPKESFTVEAFSGTYYVTSSVGLNIRRGPSTNSDILGSLSYGKETTVTGKVGSDWFEISYQGSKGYISAQYVSSEPVYITSTHTEEKAEEFTTTTENTNVGHDFNPYFSDTPMVLLFLAIVAVVILIGITAFSFFGHDHNGDYNENDDYIETDYDDSYDDYEDDDEYDSNYDNGDY